MFLCMLFLYRKLLYCAVVPVGEYEALPPFLVVQLVLLSWLPLLLLLALDYLEGLVWLSKNVFYL